MQEAFLYDSILFFCLDFNVKKWFNISILFLGDENMFDKESTGLYLIAGGVILFVLAQSIFFFVKAWQQGKNYHRLLRILSIKHKTPTAWSAFYM